MNKIYGLKMIFLVKYKLIMPRVEDENDSEQVISKQRIAIAVFRSGTCVTRIDSNLANRGMSSRFPGGGI